MIAIIMPTRGLLFTKVLEAVERERDKTWQKFVYFLSDGLPIPECQNELVQKALAYKDKDGAKITHLWFVEEDTVPPEGSFQELFRQSEDIAFIDYGVGGWSCSAVHKDTGEILWCGLGCTMVKRHVFEQLEAPWFRTDKMLRLNDWQWIDNPVKYGGQDIYFCTKAKENALTLKKVDGECVHLQLNAIGKRESNNGFHDITQKSTIKNYQFIEREW